MTQTTGLTEYRSSMTLAAARVGAGAALATRKAGANITRDAKTLAPVGTPESTGVPGYVGGNLRASIGMKVAGDGRMGSMRVEVSPTAHYGIYVEMGTSRMAAQPYLRPATDRHVPAWMAALEQAAGGGLT